MTVYRGPAGRSFAFVGPDARAWANPTLAGDAIVVRTALSAGALGLSTQLLPDQVVLTTALDGGVVDYIVTFTPSAMVLTTALDGATVSFGEAPNIQPDQMVVTTAVSDGEIVASDGAPSWLQSVSIESNGWVLRVEGEWPASTFASFDLDPNGSPKVTVATTSAGFDRVSGNQAAANSARARSAIVGTKPLRRAFPNDSQLDETDLGGGVRRVRIALSRYVYPGDPVTVTFGAGWRAGLSGGTVSGVGNNSTQAKPLPIARWVCPTNIRAAGPFDLELLVAAHEPNGLDAVAAVKFVCYDGTNTHEQWAALSASPHWGDGLRCWRATMNPTGLSAGLITCHWEVYPWCGAVRRSGTGHVTDALAPFNTVAERPVHIAWDPAGTRYPERHIVIDPVAGTTTPASVTIASTLAAAKAGTRAASVSVAKQALYLANASLPAANGFSAKSRVYDGAILTLAAGTHNWGAQTVTSGATCDECRIIIQGDPDDADPRANCILEAGATPAMRGNLVWVRNCTIGMGGTQLIPSNTGNRWMFSGCTMQGRSGFETSTNGLWSSMPSAGVYRFDFFDVRWWRYGTSFGGTGANAAAHTVRNVEFGRGAQGKALVNARRIVDSTVPDGGTAAVGGWDLTAEGDGAYDCIVWNVEARGIRNTEGLSVPNNRVGTATPSNPRQVRRYAVVNLLLERTNLGGIIGNPLAMVGTGDEVVHDCILEGCTVVGQRINWCYNDASDGVSDIPKSGNVVRNSHFDRLPTKHDANVPTNPNAISSWSINYGVGYEGSTFMNRVTSAGFEHEFFGVRSTRDPATADGGTPGPGPGNNAGWPAFVEDRSQFQPGPKDGFGDYRPQSGSPLRTFGANPRCLNATCDTYRDGTARSGGGWAAGSERPA